MDRFEIDKVFVVFGNGIVEIRIALDGDVYRRNKLVPCESAIGPLSSGKLSHRAGILFAFTSSGGIFFDPVSYSRDDELAHFRDYRVGSQKGFNLRVSELEVVLQLFRGLLKECDDPGLEG